MRRLEVPDDFTHMGRFTIPYRWLGEIEVRKLIRSTLVIDARVRHDPLGVEYVAVSSEHFLPRQKDEAAPVYSISYTEEVHVWRHHGEVTKTVTVIADPAFVPAGRAIVARRYVERSDKTEDGEA